VVDGVRVPSACGALNSSRPRPLERLDPGDREQIRDVVEALREVLGDALVGAYLHGSAVLAGLRPPSDIDVVAVAARRTTRADKRRLIARLLDLSGPAAPTAPARRPLEVTIVAASDVRPWRYPPRMDFQYGEWWRSEFSNGEVEPWTTPANPDLALLVKMALDGDAPVFGPPPAEVFDPIPDADLLDALVTGAEEVVRDLEGDTRNVVLTLARVWTTVAAGTIGAKDAAAEWALARLPAEHHAVLVRARDIYLGTRAEQWGDLRARVTPCAEAMLAEIRAAAREGRRPRG
jgi:predicted nucleotidyltransferase